MLSDLRIRDFAIIDDLYLEFGPGFIVFTGETGAGKSIIIDAVEMLLGGRAESVNIRTGASRAIIEGSFFIPESIREEVSGILEMEDLLDDPEYVTLGREIRREGRNICRVNGRVVTLSVLREIGQWLVDVHGQSEHLSLLRVREHVNMLDRFAQVEDLMQDYDARYRGLIQVRRDLEELRLREADSVQRADLLTFQINEIESSALTPGEDQELLDERTRLANAEQLTELVQQAITALDEGIDNRPATTDLLGQVVHSLESLSKVDHSMQGEETEARNLAEMAVELVRRLRTYRERIEFDPRRLDEVEERLGLIRNLQRKYGEDVPAILAHADQARLELESITHAEERMNELKAQETEHLQALGQIGLALSRSRREAGSKLAYEIDSELSDLRMSGAKFGIDQGWQEDEEGVPAEEQRLAFYPTGIDEVEFLVEPNPGEGLKPLAKIASGGETTRLMLALKSVLVQADRTPTLIFDEIDQGIGGRVGAIVGRKLWRLGREHQVLCITHLPQLAAFGDQHFNVVKHIEGGRTTTVVYSLEEDKRVSELAVMLGGETESNLESAQHLLQDAAEFSQAV
ncbi:MAG: DNA repair protein RecN [Anaerolineales bacterium]|nr:DNA repair protein RecN [Anaerolineales bacterium]